ncbi:MAG: hypothetical protein JO108_31365 [Acidobacteriaceae bacterium]|nr:hypothetical protein [Acidobacteriaceae bacterium]
MYITTELAYLNPSQIFEHWLRGRLSRSSCALSLIRLHFHHYIPIQRLTDGTRVSGGHFVDLRAAARSFSAVSVYAGGQLGIQIRGKAASLERFG